MIVSDSDRPSSPIELRHASTSRAIFVVVPERRFLLIHGVGPRSAADFQHATVVLRTAAEMVRNSLPRSERVLPPRQIIEITWPIDGELTVDEIVEALASARQPWGQMIELPRITEAGAIRALDAARRLGGRDIPLVRLIHLREGRAAQILRTGNELASACARRLLELVFEAGFRPIGDLHEIVLADSATVGHDRARSIVRVPIRPV
jgi:hypothetical protein